MPRPTNAFAALRPRAVRTLAPPGLVLVALLGACGTDAPTGTEQLSPSTIAVTVTDGAGPVPGAILRLYRNGPYPAADSAVTDAAGEATFAGVDPGDYHVALEVPTPYEPAEGETPWKPAASGTEATVDVAFELTASVVATDIDGNRYRTVGIGEQRWMAENLDVSRFRNGDPIPEVTAAADWMAAWEDQQPAWSYYGNDPALGAAYGKLYNAVAVNDPRGLCPEGWHVPSDGEWTELEAFLGMDADELTVVGYRGTDQGGQLKSPRTASDPHPRWEAPNAAASDAVAFTALANGYRTGEPQYRAHIPGAFAQLGVEATFWTSSGFGRGIDTSRPDIYRGTGPGFGFSVRCVRD